MARGRLRRQKRFASRSRASPYSLLVHPLCVTEKRQVTVPAADIAPGSEVTFDLEDSRIVTTPNRHARHERPASEAARCAARVRGSLNPGFRSFERRNHRIDTRRQREAGKPETRSSLALQATRAMGVQGLRPRWCAVIAGWLLIFAILMRVLLSREVPSQFFWRRRDRKPHLSQFRKLVTRHRLPSFNPFEASLRQVDTA